LKGYADFTRAKANRTAMIYAGGNDGMLHGFTAGTGAEKIAYVPQGVIPTWDA
jgi:type IV pilus assembly protein PilY1